MEKLLSSQPESYKPLIKRSLKLYQKAFLQVFWLSIIISIITFTPRLLSSFIGVDILATLPPTSLHWLWVAALNLFSLMIFIAILWHIFCVMRNVHEPLIEDFNVGMKKVFLVFVAAIIQNAIIFVIALTTIGLNLLLKEFRLFFSSDPFGMTLTASILIGQFIAIIYILVIFIFYLPLIAIENKNVLSSLARSVSLVRKNWWRTFFVQITPWFYYLLALTFIRVIGIPLPIFLTSPVAPNFWVTILHLLIFALLIPWIAAIMLVQLRDLELRKGIAKK